ncbi:hypothetical protein Tco_0153308 [Tanacetum coccineum]
MNVPIFVGTFSVMTDFAVLKDMDAYRDEGMNDIIVGEPFLRKEVKVSKGRAFCSLNNDICKITIAERPYAVSIQEDTANRAALHQRPLRKRNKDQYAGLEVGWIRRIQKLDMAYWGFLGVRTTLDIFQNIILIPYLEYGVLSPLDTAY